jgi:hypothetical protein
MFATNVLGPAVAELNPRGPRNMFYLRPDVPEYTAIGRMPLAPASCTTELYAFYCRH